MMTAVEAQTRRFLAERMDESLDKQFLVHNQGREEGLPGWFSPEDEKFIKTLARICRPCFSVGKTCLHGRASQEEEENPLCGFLQELIQGRPEHREDWLRDYERARQAPRESHKQWMVRIFSLAVLAQPRISLTGPDQQKELDHKAFPRFLNGILSSNLRQALWRLDTYPDNWQHLLRMVEVTEAALKGRAIELKQAARKTKTAQARRMAQEVVSPSAMDHDSQPPTTETPEEESAAQAEAESEVSEPGGQIHDLGIDLETIESQRVTRPSDAALHPKTDPATKQVTQADLAAPQVASIIGKPKGTKAARTGRHSTTPRNSFEREMEIAPVPGLKSLEEAAIAFANGGPETLRLLETNQHTEAFHGSPKGQIEVFAGTAPIYHVMTAPAPTRFPERTPDQLIRGKRASPVARMEADCGKCGGWDHHDLHCQYCIQCGSYGHQECSCPQLTTHCQLCKAVGHANWDCPSRLELLTAASLLEPPRAKKAPDVTLGSHTTPLRALGVVTEWAGSGTFAIRTAAGMDVPPPRRPTVATRDIPLPPGRASSGN